MSGTVTYTVATAAELNADIQAISNGGSAAAANTNYLFLITADLALTANIAAINLISGDALSIQGDNVDGANLAATLDGGGSDQGFMVNSGQVTLANLDLTALRGSGGGAIDVGAGASVSTSNVTITGSGGNAAAGGAVYLAQGGTLAMAGGSVAGGAGGNGVFIQGSAGVTLSDVTVTGAIADETGAHLGAGVGSVIAQGTVTLSAANKYTGGTTDNGSLTLAAAGAGGTGPIAVNGTLSLTAAGASGTDPITFGTPAGDTLIIEAGDAPAGTIFGFIPNPAAGSVASDVIDLRGIGLATGAALAAGNQLTVSGPGGGATLNLDPSVNYGADSFVLTSDGAGGTSLTVARSGYLVGSEAALNAALALIDVGGQFAGPNSAYTITLTAGFALTSDIDAIDLLAGSTVTIDGGGFAIDGGGAHRGFFDYAGGLTLKNLTLQNMIAAGGAGGNGAIPGGGGAGLGGGLFVAAGGAATLSNVTFLDDSAIGGAGGSVGTVGVGGGGGLGGAGGWAAAGVHNPLDGGGGGIGVAAVGGSASGGTAQASGGPSLIAGTGGGGNAGGTKVTHTGGSGRGGGGSRTIYMPIPATAGGLPGFGGGAASGMGAGFGGGGANSAGGWGGGGSGANNGGFGAGTGVAGGAGGGLGAGGDVFVQQGGSLTILGGTASGGIATGGAGGNGGGAGSGLGAGVFVQGTGGLILAPAAGQTLTLNDPIADGAGSGGSGTASLSVSGAGTAVLAVTNTFTGGTTLRGGTLSLQAPGAAGGGPIYFAYGTSATLAIGAGNLPSGFIGGFLPNDVIDLQGIGTASSATIGAGNVLTVSGGSVPLQLAMDPAQNFTGETFVTAPDTGNGTLLTAVDTGGDVPPSISGTGTITGDDHTPFSPLPGVTVASVIPGQIETVTLTLSSTANGALSNLGGGTYDPGAGVYTVSGTATSVTAALDGLLFTPTINQVAPGQTVATTFTLSATDGVMTSTTEAATAVVTALNDAPVINGVGNALVDGYWNVPLNPFATAMITDPDLGASETVTLSVGSNGTLSLPSTVTGVTLTSTGPGAYTFSAASPAAVTAAIDALQLTTVPNPSVPGYTITYVGMSVSDGIAAPVMAQAEVLTGLPIFTGVASGQIVVDGQTIDPFSSVSVTDSAGLSIQGLTIDVYDSSSNYLNTTDANGILSGAGLTKVGAGLYTLAPGSTQFVTSELESLVFTPTNSNTAAVTTDFNLAAFDGATTADNGDTSVIAQPNPAAPSVTGTVAGQSVADNATIAPFAAVTITDGNPTPSDSLTISLIDSASGTISDANGVLSGAGLTETAPGVYALAATSPQTLTAELDAVVFTPTFDEVAPGSSVTTEMALSVSNPNATITDPTTTVTGIPSAVQPVIGGTMYGQLVADSGATIDPFSAVTITDGNPAPVVSAAIAVNDISAGLMIATPSDADGLLLGAGLTHAGTGIYTLAAADPASLAAELDALVFAPTPGLVGAGQTVTTSFTLSVADHLAIATDYNTAVIITPDAPPAITLDPIEGTNAVNAADALAGFSITGTTTNVEDGQTVWVLIGGLAFAGMVAGGIWSAPVSSVQALSLGDGTVTAYAYATNQAGITTRTMSETFTVDLAGAVAASPSISPGSLAFGAMRVGAVPVTKSVTIGNGTVANADQSSLSYALGGLPGGVGGDATANGTIVSGRSASVTLTLSAATSANLTGTSASIALTSLAPANSGLADATLPAGSVNLSGKVYAPAVAQLSTPAINFGVVHVGDAISQTVTVMNAASGVLTDVLTGGFGSVSSGFSGSGTLGSGLTAGTSGALTIGLKTTSSGSFSGSAALNLSSHDPDLANIAAASGPITLTGTVDSYAVAALKKVSGSATLTQSGTNYTLAFGTLATGAPAASATLGAYNAASGLADLLAGSFTVAAGAGFGNSGFAAFSGLGAGQTDAAPTISVSTATPGTYSETITLTPAGSNAGGYSAALPAETLTVTATVSTPVTTLTTGVDTASGGAGNDLIVAGGNTLSSGDSINGGGGVNTLALAGGGTFNLAAPPNLSNIQLITAQEGQGTTAQTVTLRSGLNATMNVASDIAGDPSPGITIIGAANSDVINLGTGNDTVTPGAGETVNGGGGNNTFIVTASTIKSTIHGGTGMNWLVVTGGGTVAMGSGIDGVGSVSLTSTTSFTANAIPSLRISGSAAGGDVITLGAPGQSVMTASANETVKATAANAGAQIIATGANSTLEITTGGTVTLNSAAQATTVKLDSPTVLHLNGLAFLTAVGNSNGGDTIFAGGANQTLSGGKADTFVGYSGGSDTFLDKASAINGATIQNFLTSDRIDVSDLAFSGAKLTISASGGNTAVKAVSGSTSASWTLAGTWSAAGFSLTSDGKTGTLITHS